MRYLIYYNGQSFYTKWFEPENHYMKGMIIFDLESNQFTTDGDVWYDITEDHL